LSEVVETLEMNGFEELWLVDEDEEANQLMKLGWKFVQIVYVDREVRDYKGLIFQKYTTVATVKVAKFLLGRPKGIGPREKNSFGSLEKLDEYVERLLKKEA